MFTFLGAMGLVLGYLVYRDNRSEINNKVKTVFNKMEGKKMVKDTGLGYYAATETEKRFDDEIRETIKAEGNKVDMANYIQQQEILNQLRKLRDREKDVWRVSTGPDIVARFNVDTKTTERGLGLTEVVPYGYIVPEGYMGRIGDDKYMLFETEGAYREYLLS